MERLEPRVVPSAVAVPAPFTLRADGFGPMMGHVAAITAPQALVSASVVAAPMPTAAVTAAPRAVASGPIVHTVVSPFQRTATRIRVLLPDGYDPSRTYRTIYVLPVEAGNGTRYGDGLRVVQQANLHNKHQIVFVAPSFSDTPWYADHASNPRVRQESHLIQFVIPFMQQRYSVSPLAADRLLLGFSKSGYGAFTLLLRNPGVFGKAFAWDSPLAISNPTNAWDFMTILGSKSNFGHYQITRLLRTQAPRLAGGPPRLFLAGYSNPSFRSDHAQVASLMRSLGIPHRYDPGRYQAHVWTSGWVSGGVSWLAS